MGKTMRTVALLLLAFALNAHGADISAYVATTGNDSNDCLSSATACASPGRALTAMGGHGNVYVLDAGPYYNVQLDIVHGQYVNFIGPCPTKAQFYTIAGGTVLWAEDNATATAKCIKFSTVGNGSTAIRARQFAIVDWEDSEIGHFPLGNHVYLDEMAKGNCIGSITVSGDANYDVLVQGKSMVALSCAITFTNSPVIGDLLRVQGQSYALASGVSYSGSVTITGYSYYVGTQSCINHGSVSFPGPGGAVSSSYGVFE